MSVCVYMNVYNYFVCVCFQASLSVCVFAVVLSGHLLLELLIPPKSSAPVVHSFADILGLSLVYMPTLHVVEKY